MANTTKWLRPRSNIWLHPENGACIAKFRWSGVVYLVYADYETYQSSGADYKSFQGADAMKQAKAFAENIQERGLISARLAA